MKPSRKRNQKKVEETFEEADDSSEDEAPEVVSNATMKSSYADLKKQMESLKKQIKEAEKEKRRRKQELFVAQKKAKLSKFPETEGNANEDNQSAHISGTDLIKTEDNGNANANAMKVKPTRKVYPSLNITVEPLTKIDDSRASAALDFKSRRLAKVQRESVKTAVISYQKKQEVRRQ